MALTVLTEAAERPGTRPGPAVRLEGGLLGPDILERLETGQLPGQRPADFGLSPGRSLVDEVAAAYRDARDLWQIFRRRLDRLPEDDPATGPTREGWVAPLLNLLGYNLRYNRQAVEVDGIKFGVSHRAGENDDAPPVHIVGARRELGRVDPSAYPRLSPHALLQEFLNRSDRLWGLVTNGRVLRLLRKSPLLRRQAYVEFDLEAIFEGERFREFNLFYRLIHRSRLPAGVADGHECWLERYHQEALAQGNRARDRLRDGVESCLKLLANGFLRRRPPGPRPDPEGLYRDLLRLVYRFLFLLVAEDRGLLGGNDLYREHYGVSRLRRLVDSRSAYTDHEDLWLSLRVLWELLRDPTPAPQLGGRPLAALLGLSVLDGGLFEPLELENWSISNRDLLGAFYHLVYYDEGGGPRRVNYAALDVEELGSVYESLLDNRPVIGSAGFDFAAGTERKATGSYYTPPELVAELIKSALEPVLADRLAGARTPAEKERAILSIKVVDPAAGSGHFLLAAARRLGKELARVRTGEEEPSPEAQREAVRDVITHCIYGVDKNPLAVELCKVALWLEGQTPGKPLTFLDHRIRCGDSLLGVFNLEALQKGIPDEAYERADPDEKAASRRLRQVNHQARAGQLSLGLPAGLEADLLETAVAVEELERTPDDSAQTVAAKARRYQEAQGRLRREAQACDLWTAAFFWELTDPSAPTTEAVRRCLAGPAALDGRMVGRAEALAGRHRFFHWPLEFPDVFLAGGFDVVLCNPPWERVKLQEEEFFASRDPEIARAPNKAARERLIRELPRRNPGLWAEYRQALRAAEAASRFLRVSGRFPLTGRGDVNTYAVFAELARDLLRPRGQAGVIVPTGIATDATTQHFFRDLVEGRRLVSLYDFENRKKLFPAVDSRVKFCLLTMAGPGAGVPAAEFAFFCHEARDLGDPERRFTLSPADLRLVNPNTRTAPIFRSRRDAELTKHIYRRVPVLVDETRGRAGNPWGVAFLAMFHMSNDSHLFRNRAELAGAGFRLVGNVFVRGEERYLPLYEAKMIHQFNHRFGDYADQPPDSKDTQLPDIPAHRLADPDYAVLPRYWVPEEEVEARLAGRWDRGWLLGWRDITNVTNERTVIAAVIPRVGVGNKVPLIIARRTSQHPALLAATFCSFPLDYAARQKVGGTTLNFFIFEQLPVLPPDVFDRPCPWSPNETLADWFRPRVLELTYTAWDLRPFALDLGYEGPPFRWDEERRFSLRAELDAAFFILYLGTPEEWEAQASPELKTLFLTPRDAAAYILDQFPIVRRRDEERYGHYRTREAVLAAYDRLLRAIRSGALRPFHSRDFREV
jgi:hypothetical protein